MRGGGAFASKKLLAAFAVLAVAFVVLAAVPAVVTDSDAASGKDVYIAGVGFQTDAASANKAITDLGKTVTDSDANTGYVVFYTTAVSQPVKVEISLGDNTNVLFNGTFATAGIHVVYWTWDANGGGYINKGIESTADNYIAAPQSSGASYTIAVSSGDGVFKSVSINLKDESSQVTTVFVDNSKVVNDSYSADGTYSKPFKTLYDALKSIGNNGSSATSAYVEVLSDETGDGFTVGNGGTRGTTKSGTQIVSIDFNGHKYTAGTADGSVGTVSQGFRVLKDNIVILRNGSLDCDKNSGVAQLVHTYGNLVLDSFSLDGSNMRDGYYAVPSSDDMKVTYTEPSSETIKVNYGYLTVTGKSDITAKNGQYAVVVEYWSTNSNYVNGVSAVFDEEYTGTVKGIIDIEWDAYTAGSTTSVADMLGVEFWAGTFDGEFQDVSGVGYFDASKGKPTGKTDNKGREIYEGAFVKVPGSMALGNVVIYGGKFTQPIDASKVSVDVKGVLDADIVLHKDSAKTVKMEVGGEINGTISNIGENEKLSTAVLENVKATAATTFSAGSVVINGSVVAPGTDGKITVTGDATISGTLGDGVTLVVAEGAKLSASGFTIGENAKMSVFGTVDGAVVNNGTIEVQTGADVSGMTKSGTGALVDKTSESEMSEMKISGTSETFVGTEATVFGAKQLITVDGSWTLVNGTNIVIKGMLIVPEGATLTIEAGATITIDNGAVAQIDGTLVIQPADDGKDNAAKFVVRSGTLELNGAADIKGGLDVLAGSAIAGKAVVGQDAAVVVTSDGVLTIASGASFEVQKSAVLTINGQATGAFDNYGTIVYDAQTENTGSATINMLASGAVVDVKAYTANVAGKITITDADLAITKNGKTPVKVSEITNSKVNKIEISAAPGTDSVATVGGFTIVEDASSKATAATTTKGYGLYTDSEGNKTLNVNKTEIAGDLTVSSSLTDDATGTTSSATATLKAVTGEKISFPGTTVVSLGFTVELVSGVKADVSGSIDATAKSTSPVSQATFTNNGAITVSGDGIVKTNAKLTETGTVNAVQYETGTTDKIMNYVTIDKAIATVSADGSTVKALNAFGTNTVKTTAELPANVTLTVDTGAKVSVGSSAGDDVVLTIANGATVKNNGAITVNGVLYAVNKTNVKGNTPVSDVYSEQTENGKTVREGWAKWTNIVTALSEAQSGETITISKDATDASGKQQYVDIKGSTEIKSGVTLVVPSDKASLKLADGVTLTISGTLTTAEDIYADTVFAVEAKNLQNDKSSAIVVKGVLNFDVAGAQGFKHSTATVPASGSTAAVYSALSKGAPIAGAYYLTDDHQVISTLEIALTAANDWIYIRGAVTAGDITFAADDDLKQLVVGYGLSATGTTSDKVKVDTVLTVSSLTLADGAELVLHAATRDPLGSFTGTVVVGDASVAVVGGSSGTAAATFTEKDGKLLLSGAIALGDKGDSLAIAAGTVYANGLVQTTGTGVEDVAFSIAEGAVLSVEKLTPASVGLDAAELAVYGSLLVVNGASATIDELAVVGTVSISATTASAAAGSLSVKDLYVGLSDDDLTTGAAAAFNGAFTLDGGFAYIADGAALDDAASAVLSADDVKKSAFYVEDKLWFTVYSNASTTKIPYITETYVEDAELVGWMDVKGKVLSNTFASPATRPADIALGGDNEKLTAVLNKYVFEIEVIADAGIENIAIDGNILPSSGSNKYSTVVAAGSHTVSYTLKNGYSGTATLTVNGEKQSGLTFSTVSGVYEYGLQLSGVSASGYTPVSPVTPTEDKDDGLTITDYLLIVLVVLIVIMAVIVAMRLMRS